MVNKSWEALSSDGSVPENLPGRLSPSLSEFVPSLWTCPKLLVSHESRVTRMESIRQGQSVRKVGGLGQGRDLHIPCFTCSRWVWTEGHSLESMALKPVCAEIRNDLARFLCGSV